LLFPCSPTKADPAKMKVLFVAVNGVTTSGYFGRLSERTVSITHKALAPFDESIALLTIDIPELF